MTQDDGLKMNEPALPDDVQKILDAYHEALATDDPNSPDREIGQATAGIYAFYDYDNEPIYVGQTRESFKDRLGRHFTGQRSDAVGKYILDPFEVYKIALWSLPAVEDLPAASRKRELDRYEYAVYKKLLDESKFKAILNEGKIKAVDDVPDLGDPLVLVIVPKSVYKQRSHPDVRIARRAQTVSLLARTIIERKVSKGARQTLVTQTRRLDDLARRRFEALGGSGAVPLEDSDGTVDEPEA